MDFRKADNILAARVFRARPAETACCNVDFMSQKGANCEEVRIEMQVPDSEAACHGHCLPRKAPSHWATALRDD